MTDYAEWFRGLTHLNAHDWQRELGADVVCRDRLVRIPTGFGKTAGVVLPWLFHRAVRRDEAWPRRLVFCLPMRVLVEQTERSIRDWLERAGLRADVGLHVLMGGVRAERWVLDIDSPAILVGTQDMLLSRALNRGYASPRGIWPMEYGLLHQDALWILDEVQLMDVGLATSAQLAAFRDQDVAEKGPRLRPVHTWWMSATLKPHWLATVDRPAPADPPLAIPAAMRKGGLFDVRKPLERAADIHGPDAIAKAALARHVPGTLTLVLVNRVATANAVYEALDAATMEGKGRTKARREDAPELRLVHSRFRGHERARWADEFLKRGVPLPASGRIVVATQVVEAGVDFSARTLVTELAPWPSLVQRFGRVARYEGEAGTAVVVGGAPADEKAAAPYAQGELVAADQGIARLLAREGDASPRSLEAFDDELSKSDPELMARLFPYSPLHVLRRRDLDDLFDTSADLSGADLDVSRFIRSGEERDVTVFWRALEPESGRGPGRMANPGIRLDEPPRREELCPVPIGDIRAWKAKAYVFDYIDGVWSERDPKRIVPGMTVLLAAGDGGYTLERGWDPKAKSVEPVPLPADSAEEKREALAAAAAAEDGEEVSIAAWKSIATHGREAEGEARALCVTLGVPATITRVVALAARWHDAGKAHPVFQGAIRADRRAEVPAGARRDLAKAPDDAWARPPYPDRPGFRHELASTLALFELLRRTEPLHPALLGPHRELLEALGASVDVPDETDALVASPLAAEIAALSAEEFDLLAWLVCAHHGKVRTSWTSTPRDQEMRHGGIHGVCEGDVLPAFAFADADGCAAELPSVVLSLAGAELGIGTRYGASWAERVAGLTARHGPFALTFLEAVLRVADVRASKLETEDSWR
ncbi:MAG: DEAD/DEAH box helicase [Deltaproteobacteria bacterium]|nr:DEAD/DEAH box helicase [Deltaproteobacteria bacterium]